MDLCQVNYILNKNKKVLDTIYDFKKSGSIMIFDLEIKRKTRGCFKHLSWFFDEHDDVEKRKSSNKAGFVFISLFYMTLISFCFMAFYVTPCFILPIADEIKFVRCQVNTNANKAFDIPIICAFDSDDQAIQMSVLNGVYDSTKLISYLFGFTSSSQNYIRSTSYRFT